MQVNGKCIPSQNSESWFNGLELIYSMSLSDDIWTSKNTQYVSTACHKPSVKTAISPATSLVLEQQKRANNEHVENPDRRSSQIIKSEGSRKQNVNKKIMNTNNE